MTSFVLYSWSRVPTVNERLGGTWYQIAFAPGIVPLVIQFYIDGMDAGDLPSQVTSDPAPDQDEQVYPLNSNRVNVRWVSYDRSRPVPGLAQCYDITAAVQSNFAVYKNALAIRQIGLTDRRPCSFDLYVWIPEAMHTDPVRQVDRRRLQEGTEPCLRSLYDEATGLCEPVVHIRPGSQFSTPSGYFALDREMTAAKPPVRTAITSTFAAGAFGTAITDTSSSSITTSSSTDDLPPVEANADNWWVWLIVGVSIVFVLCFLAVVCGLAAYMRYNGPTKTVAVQKKAPVRSSSRQTLNRAPPSSTQPRTKNVAAAQRAKQARSSSRSRASIRR